MSARKPRKETVEAETKSALEQTVLTRIIQLTNLPTEKPEMEMQFYLPNDDHPYDFAWPERKILLEVDGGIWTNGAHTRGGGKIRDDDKGNYAAALGWRILRFNTDFETDPHSRLMRLVEAYNYGD